jgi:hypothetical protein
MKLRFVALMAVLFCNVAALDAVAASYKIEPISTAAGGSECQRPSSVADRRL